MFSSQSPSLCHTASPTWPPSQAAAVSHTVQQRPELRASAEQIRKEGEALVGPEAFRDVYRKVFPPLHFPRPLFSFFLLLLPPPPNVQPRLYIGGKQLWRPSNTVKYQLSPNFGPCNPPPGCYFSPEVPARRGLVRGEGIISSKLRKFSKPLRPKTTCFVSLFFPTSLQKKLSILEARWSTRPISFSCFISVNSDFQPLPFWAKIEVGSPKFGGGYYFFRLKSDTKRGHHLGGGYCLGGGALFGAVFTSYFPPSVQSLSKKWRISVGFFFCDHQTILFIPEWHNFQASYLGRGLYLGGKTKLLGALYRLTQKLDFLVYAAYIEDIYQ